MGGLLRPIEITQTLTVKMSIFVLQGKDGLFY